MSSAPTTYTSQTDMNTAIDNFALKRGYDFKGLLKSIVASLGGATLIDSTAITASNAELNIMDGVLATTAEINRAADVSTRIVNATAATLTVDEATHEGKLVTLNRAGGIAVTLPAATGSGGVYRFLIGTTFTSSATIKVVGNDTMVGGAILAQDAADTAVFFEAGGTDDTITFDGTTTGGYVGTKVELIDMATDLWYVEVIGKATGTEATPFSATV